MVLDLKRRSGKGRGTRFPRNLLVAALLLRAAIAPAFAEDKLIPTPSQVIYPGDIIRDGMLADVSVYDIPNIESSLVETRAELIGKVAKRTLLPGRGIVALAIENPKAVANGAQVKLVYRDGGLTIITTALALEAGGVGDTIKVRNSDSGSTISGTIQPDGSVSVSDS